MPCRIRPHHRLLRAALASVALIAALVAPVTADAQTTPVTQSTDTAFTSYAFASEIGSGIYEIGGRTIQVYRLTFRHNLREPDLNGRPGFSLILPVTVGFFDFKTADLVHLQLPNSIGALSVEPGIEFDYFLSPNWHVYPYIKAGGSFASASGASAIIYGTGVHSDYSFIAWHGEGLSKTELTYAGVHYSGDLPHDSFTRLRQGAELRERIGPERWRHAPELSPYAVIDIYLNAPSDPASGISPRTLQFETGLMFEANPQWKLWGMSLPRLGIGYRAAGKLSGWRVVLGDPF
ncbi:MAG TPA: hypothetical protein VLW26_04975 [Steroidobacteraceae bacterium]|nr:hypothetical protein [Steroidobacteraceae bacterium]